MIVNTMARVGSLVVALSSLFSFAAFAEGTQLKPTLECEMSMNGQKKVALTPTILPNNQVIMGNDLVSYEGHTVAVRYLLGDSYEPVDVLQIIVDDKTTTIQDPGPTNFDVRGKDNFVLWCLLQK